MGQISSGLVAQRLDVVTCIWPANPRPVTRVDEFIGRVRQRLFLSGWRSLAPTSPPDVPTIHPNEYDPAPIPQISEDKCRMTQNKCRIARKG
jgi:hypothetical protein